jgi:hypothetical protein
VRGGVITPHRAMVGLPWTIWRLFTTLLLVAFGLVVLWAALPWLGTAWQVVFARARDYLRIDAPLGEQTLPLPFDLTFTVPSLAVPTPLPGPQTLLIFGIGSAAVFLLSFVLPGRFTPLSYFFRLLAVLMGIAVGFFALWAAAFPYRLQDQVFLMLTAGLVVMALVPPILGLTLHVFDLAFWKKILLTLIILAHFAVFLPLQALAHLVITLHATAVVMPVLFLLFGLLPDVLIFVAFYGWALSWRGEFERMERVLPVHLGARGGERGA